MDAPTAARTLADLKVLAAARVAQYPQYRGHFDGHVLVRVLVNVRTKLGQAFVAGDLTIAPPTCEKYEARLGMPTDSRSVWSFRTGYNTLINDRKVELLYRAAEVVGGAR